MTKVLKAEARATTLRASVIPPNQEISGYTISTHLDSISYLNPYLVYSCSAVVNIIPVSFNASFTYTYPSYSSGGRNSSIHFTL